jgi:hypothetical protein
MAIKSSAYIKEVEKQKLAKFRDEILMSIVVSLAKYLDGRVKSLCSHPIIQATSIIKDLLFRAFHEVWKRRPHRYQNLSSTFENVISANPLALSYGETFEQKIIDAGGVLFNGILF